MRVRFPKGSEGISHGVYAVSYGYFHFLCVLAFPLFRKARSTQFPTKQSVTPRCASLKEMKDGMKGHGAENGKAERGKARRSQWKGGHRKYHIQRTVSTIRKLLNHTAHGKDRGNPSWPIGVR